MTHRWPRAFLFLAPLCRDLCTARTDSGSVPWRRLDGQATEGQRKFREFTARLKEGLLKENIWKSSAPGEQLSKLKSPQSTSNTTSSSGCLWAAWKSPIHLVTMSSWSQRISPSPATRGRKESSVETYQGSNPAGVSGGNLRVTLALWCVKMCAVKKANHFLPLWVLPDKHLHVKIATSCISAAVILRHITMQGQQLRLAKAWECKIM